MYLHIYAYKHGISIVTMTT